MTSMPVPTGYLVVLKSPEQQGEAGKRRNPHYSGVNRVPSYPSPCVEEQAAIDDYVFGGIKDDESNVIPHLERAVDLLNRLSVSRRRFELIFCCAGPGALDKVPGPLLTPLGYDVGAVRGDYWSIVNDFARGKWAEEFQVKLNAYGLFDKRVDAESYLNQYRRWHEPDAETCFDIVYVARVET